MAKFDRDYTLYYHHTKSTCHSGADEISSVNALESDDSSSTFPLSIMDIIWLFRPNVLMISSMLIAFLLYHLWHVHTTLRRQNLLLLAILLQAGQAEGVKRAIAAES
jgi:hypothetical protein